MLQGLWSYTERGLAYVTSPRGFRLSISFYMLAMLLVLGVAFPGLGREDADQLIFTQTPSWGYLLANPPLYTWLVTAATKVFGVTSFAAVFVRMALLLAMFLFLYQGARAVLEDDRLAALAALGPLGMYYVAWLTVLDFTNTALLLAACAATFAALVRLERRGDLASYAVLGAALAVGVMAKYSFLLFSAVLLIAALFDARMRSRLLDRRILLAFAIAALVATPHALWLTDQLAGMAALADERLDFAREGGRLAGLKLGLTDAADAVVQFVMPLALILAALFWRALGPVGGRSDPSERYRRVLGIFFAILLACIFLGVIAFGVTRVRTHYMAIMILFPVYFFARAQVFRPGNLAIQLCAGIYVFLAATVLVSFVVKFFLFDPTHCTKCHRHFPAEAIAGELRKAGFEDGTIFTFWYPYRVGGNMRIEFPEARVITAQYPDIVPAPRQRPGQCLFVWARYPQGFDRATAAGFANSVFGAELPRDAAVRRIKVPMARLPERTIEVDYILLKDGLGTCR